MSNSNSFSATAEDRVARSLPWLFRTAVPGFEGAWPSA
jgi:hypothetical protein